MWGLFPKALRAAFCQALQAAPLLPPGHSAPLLDLSTDKPNTRPCSGPRGRELSGTHHPPGDRLTSNLVAGSFLILRETTGCLYWWRGHSDSWDQAHAARPRSYFVKDHKKCISNPQKAKPREMASFLTEPFQMEATGCKAHSHMGTGRPLPHVGCAGRLVLTNRLWRSFGNQGQLDRAGSPEPSQQAEPGERVSAHTAFPASEQRASQYTPFSRPRPRAVPGTGHPDITPPEGKEAG